MTIKIDFTSLYGKLDELSRKAQNETLDKALDDTKPIILMAMVEESPFDTGELSRNLGEVEKKGTGRSRALVMGVRKEANELEKKKAYYNHYGTTYIAGTHWMEKAFNNCKKDANEQLKKSLKELFKL